MSKIVSVFLFVLAVMLPGCALLTPKVETVVQYRTDVLLLAPPTTFLTTVEHIPPPDKEHYMLLNSREKEALLTKIYIGQNRAINQCNANLTAIKDWVNTESLKYDKH